MNSPKILFIDLESIARPFTTSRDKIRAEDTAVAVFQYAWGESGKAKAISLGDFPSDYKKDPFNDKKVLKAAAEIILEADIIVGHYASHFDKRVLRTRFMLNGLHDAAQHIHKMPLIDTCLQARELFAINSCSLRYLAKLLKLTPKPESHNSFWVGVMRSDPKAIKDMTKYGLGDIVTLQDVYKYIKRFMKKHPMMNHENKEACPICCSKNVSKWGFRYEGKTKYQRLKCKDCCADWRGPKHKE